MITKDKIFEGLKLLPQLEFISWDILSDQYIKEIVRWRNDIDNRQFFESQETVTEDSQHNFLEDYDKYDRADFILLYNKLPVGVFNIKNLNTFPEYGSLIGEKQYRGKRLGALAKSLIFNLWFEILDQEELYLKNRRNNTKVLDSNHKRGYSIFEEDEEYITFKVDKKSYIRNKG